MDSGGGSVEVAATEGEILVIEVVVRQPVVEHAGAEHPPSLVRGRGRDVLLSYQEQRSDVVSDLGSEELAGLPEGCAASCDHLEEVGPAMGQLSCHHACSTFGNLNSNSNSISFRCGPDGGVRDGLALAILGLSDGSNNFSWACESAVLGLELSGSTYYRFLLWRGICGPRLSFELGCCKFYMDFGCSGMVSKFNTVLDKAPADEVARGSVEALAPSGEEMGELDPSEVVSRVVERLVEESRKAVLRGEEDVFLERLASIMYSQGVANLLATGLKKKLAVKRSVVLYRKAAALLHDRGVFVPLDPPDVRRRRSKRIRLRRHCISLSSRSEE